MKYGNLNFLEPSGLLQASNGTALFLPLIGEDGTKANKFFEVSDEFIAFKTTNSMQSILCG